MSNPIQVLIVDDNEFMLRKLKRTLSEFNCTFFEATTGKDALNLIENHSFDLIIMDIKLPDMNGLEVYERAKQIQPEPGEVIFITGFPDKKTHTRALLLGACAYLSKAVYDSKDVRKTVGMALTLIKRRAYPVNIFLSYARPDNEAISPQCDIDKTQKNDLHKVKTIYDRLKDNHFFPWFDEKALQGGQYWENEIEKAIEESEFFLACLSSASSQKVGYIQKEFMLAWMKQDKIQKETPHKSYIIPIRLEEFQIPAPFNQLQHIDYFNTNWFKKLKGVIKPPRKC